MITWISNKGWNQVRGSYSGAMFRGYDPGLSSGGKSRGFGFGAYALHTGSKQVSVIKRHSIKKATMQFTLSANLCYSLHIILFRLYLLSSYELIRCYFPSKDCPGNDSLYEEFPEDAGF